VPTQVPVGSEDNPLHIALVAQGSSERLIESAMSDLEQALLDETQLTVVVDVVDSDAEALTALCASPGGTVTAAWLSGLAYAAAFEQDCGAAALQVQRGERSSGTTGEESRIIVRSALDVSGIGDLVDHNFCRLGYSDFYSWLVPSIMLTAGGVSPASLSEVIDYDDPAAMLDDMAAGDCDAAGIAASQFESLASAQARARVRTLQESVMIPFLVLVIPAQLPLAQQEQLTNALVAIANGSRASVLAPLLDQEQLLVVTDDDFSSLRSFVARSGIDLAQAGT
jgi:ABC-type phosphate/phosphonate transport system substrate-binding protein